MNAAELRGLATDWALALAVAAGLMAGFHLLQPAPAKLGAEPELALPSTEGGEWDLADQSAPAYVVNFWATWCQPCRQEIPEFTRFAREHPEIEVVGVSVDEGMGTERLGVESKRLGIAYRVLHDRSGDVARRWGVSVYPTTFVLDANRRVVASRVGVVDRMALEEMLPTR